MKKLIFSMIVALMATVAARAQQIAVVSDGTTTLYHTLQEAIEGAPAGSVIYLPGGGFPISDDVKITKKLTIIGIGHYAKSGNVDGVTTISGNLFFNEGSDDSAVMGCYITGEIQIAEGDKPVNGLLIRYCNLETVRMMNNTCKKTTVNQSFIRNRLLFYGAEGFITNSIIGSIWDINGGVLSHNIFFSTGYHSYKYHVIMANNLTICYNVIINPGNWDISGHNNAVCVYQCGNVQILRNMIKGEGDYTEDPINIGESNWDEVFVNYQGCTPSSDFHFKGDYEKYNGEYGIYGGTGFNDKGIAPVPYVVAKDVKEQTDASGMLYVKIRVNAGE